MVRHPQRTQRVGKELLATRAQHFFLTVQEWRGDGDLGARPLGPLARRIAYAVLSAVIAVGRVNRR